ncbi:PAS/PAC sensor signal transduction histidine kinase [Novosphingobium nitrogenifigens DSM 19370]|uniref:histidine kinase n=1 Tax=Novosphingobium nitrogenifigens DSM 19370 TaxID=983920 RepID=F1Z412_9SPHN|nr:ATP-binding protein [Novosphingobium nitrogenifigens]EGD60624.1 PAS/PAC sensor signal transduction histidine kinase [Novosphingobium nitrogenifigens DSM 19370]
MAPTGSGFDPLAGAFMPAGLDFTPPPMISDPLVESAALLGEMGAVGEEMWIDVIRKMDNVYADLIASQVALEERNAALEQARTFLGSVLGAISDVLIVCDAQGTVEQVNPALVGLVGQDEKAIVGTAILSLFAEPHRADILETLGVLRRGETVVGREWAALAADGSDAALSVHCSARHDAGGRFAGMVLVGRPIGELQRAYRELDAAHQRLRQTQQQLLTTEKMAALGRLVAGVAHELNNPISFVFGNMYALKRYGAAITEYLSAIDAGRSPAEIAALRDRLKIDRVLADIGPLVDGTLEGAERVRDIVQDLRRFSANQREPLESCNLVRLVHTAADWVVKALREAPEVRFDLPERMEIVSRKGQLHQILVNLVQNAADALKTREEGARITITARQEGDWAILSVADNGPGVSRGHQDKIFEPFFTTKPIGAGTGLGLYVSYTMAAKLGGSLDYADAPGGGAMFTLRLPVAGEEEVQP